MTYFSSLEISSKIGRRWEDIERASLHTNKIWTRIICLRFLLYASFYAHRRNRQVYFDKVHSKIYGPFESKHSFFYFPYFSVFASHTVIFVSFFLIFYPKYFNNFPKFYRNFLLQPSFSTLYLYLVIGRTDSSYGFEIKEMMTLMIFGFIWTWN